MEGVLLVRKPVGITSFDVIRRLRRAWRVAHPGEAAPKMGHAGTLDPLASGLMLVGVGNGTKRLAQFLKLPKTYRAEIYFGRRTDTGDREGRRVEEKEVSGLSAEAARNALSGMVGTLALPVPAYSAVKQGGEPLYKKARRGIPVALPLKAMEVRRAEFLGFRREGDGRVLEAEFDVGSGTYIRSLAEELGRRLGMPATLWNLQRTRIGDFRIEEAEDLPDNPGPSGRK